MWSHTEILNGCLLVYEHEGAEWTRYFYEQTWDYTKKNFCRGIGAWEQAIDRKGNPISRENMELILCVGVIFINPGI